MPGNSSGWRPRRPPPWRLQTADLAKSLVKTPTEPVAFVNVRLFDADAMRFVSRQTVVVDKGVIVAVGSAASVKVPAGARRSSRDAE